MALERAHTVDLDADGLVEIRTLLDAAFDGDFTEDDWEHTLGGVHVLLREGGALLGHASVVQRRCAPADPALRGVRRRRGARASTG